MSILSAIPVISSYIMLAVKLLPDVITAITSVEKLYTNATGKGAVKLETVRLTLEAAYEAAKDMNPQSMSSTSFDDLWPMLNKIISGLVALYNKTGW